MMGGGVVAGTPDDKGLPFRTRSLRGNCACGGEFSRVAAYSRAWEIHLRLLRRSGARQSGGLGWYGATTRVELTGLSRQPWAFGLTPYGFRLPSLLHTRKSLQELRTPRAVPAIRIISRATDGSGEE